MKRFKLFSIYWIAALFWISPVQMVWAQNQENAEVVRQIEQAIANRDMRSLMRVMGNDITIRIFNESNSYSAAQARYILDEFFREHPARGFKFSEVSLGTTSHFAVGDYQDRGDDKKLRVYVRIRREGREWLLRELRISENR